ncbi:DNA recombination protein RmuC [Methylocapsa sp. S129]|uniref:DNA recombination protein RmuC n=1 Tax=Methylocapsa sp. S129 TaxID=1641869 RepID=UPI00131D75A6|nr:DNA recombination protein RmuC [Methylocapsa sp. S129]
MNQTFILLGAAPISFGEALEAAAGLIALLLLCLVVGMARARGHRLRERAAAEERQRELEQGMAELARSGAELNGRLQSMAEAFGSRQSDLVRVMADRLDNVSARVGAGIESAAQTTGANLNKLNERLALIDAAQARLNGLSQEVISLKDILSNKQTRGAFGQGRMEAIVRDGLPTEAYEFQATLSNKSRPDCLIKLPGDERKMAIDAKFPLEAFTLFRDARSDEARKVAVARVRADVGKHVKDIADRYLLPGETQDLAVMFVPSESVYSDLVEHFDDVVQKAHRSKVIIVSPSLLMMAIQVMQTIVRDARMRDQAHVIQAEVGKLLEDVRRLAERTAKLDTHFRQAQEDVGQIVASSEKIVRRGERIDTMEFSQEQASAKIEALPHLRLAKGGE